MGVGLGKSSIEFGWPWVVRPAGNPQHAAGACFGGLFGVLAVAGPVIAVRRAAGHERRNYRRNSQVVNVLPAAELVQSHLGLFRNESHRTGLPVPVDAKIDLSLVPSHLTTHGAL